MKVFLTGATGFIGTALIQELMGAGHTVLGLARSEEGAKKLKDAGAKVHMGNLEDLESLRTGAKESDGIIHAGFIHDFSRFAEVCAVDKLAIETMGEVLKGSNRPFVVTSGTALISPGVVATEDMKPHDNPNFPRVSEQTGNSFSEQGVRTATIRLSPSVHGLGDHHGFIPMLINIAREKGKSAYIGEGLNRWNAVNRMDAVQVYRLALELGKSGSAYHAVGEEGITLKAIAECIGRKLNLPVESISQEKAAEHFGWFTGFAGIDCPASNKITRETLHWEPTHSSLLEDMESGVYFN